MTVQYLQQGSKKGHATDHFRLHFHLIYYYALCIYENMKIGLTLSLTSKMKLRVQKWWLRFFLTAFSLFHSLFLSLPSCQSYYDGSTSTRPDKN